MLQCCLPRMYQGPLEKTTGNIIPLILPFCQGNNTSCCLTAELPVYSCAPQWLQNSASTSTSAWQTGHSLVSPRGRSAASARACSSSGVRPAVGYFSYLPYRLRSPRHADRSAHCVLRSFSYCHACGFLQRVHHVKPAGLKLVPIETKSVSKDVSHDCNFLLCSVIIHGTEHQLVVGG